MSSIRKVFPFTIGGSILLSLFFTYVYFTGKCSMESNLLPLFAYAANALNSINAEYWIDYGTLLGGVRESKLLAHEFDLDLAAREEECPRIIKELKERVKIDGFHPYERNEWIDAKYNPILGNSGYLNKPCFRIYDADHHIYVDIDWYRTYTPEQIATTQALVNGQQPVTSAHNTADGRSLQSAETVRLPKRPGGLDIPFNYRPDATLLCNEEGIDGGDPGGCRMVEDVIPIQKFTFANGIKTFAPSHPEANLESMYGADWMVPKGKGYKKLMCSWFPTTSTAFTFLLIFTLIFPSLVYVTQYLYVHSSHLSLPRFLTKNPAYQRLPQKPSPFIDIEAAIAHGSLERDVHLKQ